MRILMQDARSLTVKACPAPGDLVWRNVGLPARSRATREALVLAGTLLLTFCWTVPVGVITWFTQPRALVRLLPVLKPVLYMSSGAQELLTTLLPVLVLKVVMSLLPHMLAAMASFEGTEARSWICSRVLRRHYCFQLVNVFLGAALSAGVLSVAIKVADHPMSLAHILGADCLCVVWSCDSLACCFSGFRVSGFGLWFRVSAVNALSRIAVCRKPHVCALDARQGL